MGRLSERNSAMNDSKLFIPQAKDNHFVLDPKAIISHALYATTHSIKILNPQGRALVVMIKLFKDYPCAAVAELSEVGKALEVQRAYLLKAEEVIELLTNARLQGLEVIETGLQGTLEELSEDHRMKEWPGSQ